MLSEEDDQRIPLKNAANDETAGLTVIQNEHQAYRVHTVGSGSENEREGLSTKDDVAKDVRKIEYYEDGSRKEYDFSHATRRIERIGKNKKAV